MKIFGLSFIIICVSMLSGWIGSYIFLQDIYTPHNNKTLWYWISDDMQHATHNTLYSLHDVEKSVTWITQKLWPSVVSIIISRDIIMYRSNPWGFFDDTGTTVRRQVWGGSGFFIHEDWLILTNKHVIQDPRSDYMVILSDGREFATEIVALDPLNDLAVIKIHGWNETFPVPHIVTESEDVAIGSFAIAIGNALAEFQNSVSLGIVSGKNRSIEAQWTFLSNLIQTDAAINPWNSWWPLLNLDGEVIWINTAIAGRTSGIWFAIALTQWRIQYILESIEKYGDIKRPFIGINYIANSPWVAQEFWLPIEYGAYIINEPWSIVAWSSADKAWIRPWDIITHINNKKIQSIQDLARILQNSFPWDMLTLEIIRNWRQIEKKLELWIY